ncbi:MAG: hypothetical protein LVR00_02150 [Rhabdochlamydiaceae bacterium]
MELYTVRMHFDALFDLRGFLTHLIKLGTSIAVNAGFVSIVLEAVFIPYPPTMYNIFFLGA